MEEHPTRDGQLQFAASKVPRAGLFLLLEEKTVTYQKGTPKRVFTILSSPRLV